MAGMFRLFGFSKRLGLGDLAADLDGVHEIGENELTQSLPV